MQPEPVAAVVKAAAARLQAAGCQTAKLDARLLVEAASGLSRADMIARPDTVLGPAQMERLEEMLARREAGEPVSRILGQREFYGRTFKVTPDVLDPRPDTETLVDAALAVLGKTARPRILDIGTGSGAIIVTLLAEVAYAAGVATDLSPAALAVAGHNATVNGVDGRLELVETVWARGVGGQFDLIVSNPPYIPQDSIAGLDREVREHDPHLALAGGADGFDAYRALLPEAASLLGPCGHIVLEFGAGQHEDVVRIARAHGLALVDGGLVRDLAGHVRCAVLVRS
jgi:release factor glutamine methyltransferase